MIYDCFLFFNELDVLRLRLAELSPVVDRFVLVENTRSFSGNPKPLHFENNKQLFRDYLDKICHIVVDDAPPKYDAAWDMETHQRNAILRGLEQAKPDDIIAIGDVDEIPRASVVRSFQGSFAALELNLYYYKLNCIDLARKWIASLLLRRSHLTTPQEARMMAARHWEHATPILRDAGWHFSYLQDAAGLRLKLQSFSHQEYNTPHFTAVSSIADRIKYGLDIVERRDTLLSCVPLDSSFPEWLLKHKKEFSHLLFDCKEFHQNRQNLIYSLLDDVQKSNRTIAELQARQTESAQQVEKIQSSRSWKLTEPIRAAAQAVRRLRNRKGSLKIK